LKPSLGILEVKGLVYTIACADAALKAADVQLLGYEPTKGGACFVVKFFGNIGAVGAAVDAALALAKRDGKQAVGYSIPRPSDSCLEMVHTENIRANHPEMSAETKEAKPDMQQVSGEVTDETDEAEIPTETDGAAETETEALTGAEVEAKLGSVPDMRSGICNLCNDPKCPRRKNEPHNLCIHYNERGE
jgi:ethanolamine utilization protein EutM